MTRPIVRIHNSETNEVIDREMTAAEFAQYNADQTANEIALAEAKVQATAKAALLSKLGITAEEAAILLS